MFCSQKRAEYCALFKNNVQSGQGNQAMIKYLLRKIENHVKVLKELLP